MIPATLDLILYQGDTFERTVTLTDSEGTPVPLEHWRIRAQVRQRPESKAILASFDVRLDDENEGVFHLKLGSEATEELNPTYPGQSYAWDLELTDHAGRVGTYLRGSVSVTAQVTR